MFARILQIILIFILHLSVSRTLPSSQNTKLSHPSLSLHAMIMSWHRVQAYTEYSIHREQHTPSTACTEYSIHWVQHTPSTAYTKYSIHWVQHTPSTAYTEYSIHRVQHTPSTVYAEYSIHRVQHTPSTAYTEYIIHRVQHTPSTAYPRLLSSLHPHDYKLTPECSINFQRASLHDRLPSTSSPWELKGKHTLSHSHVCEPTDWWIESQHPVRRPSTASQYSSNLAPSQPPKCISKLARLLPPSSHDHGLPVHHQTRSITISECISKFTRSWPPSISPNMPDFRLQMHLQARSITDSKLPRSRPPSASPNSLDYGLQVYLQVRSISAFKCISKFAPS